MNGRDKQMVHLKLCLKKLMNPLFLINLGNYSGFGQGNGVTCTVLPIT